MNMKKTYMLVIAALVSSFLYAEDPSVKEDWKKFGKDTAEAARSLGKALGTTGKKIGKDVENSVQTKYLGTWVYTGKKCVTTITIKDDKTMEIRQKDGLDVLYWEGTSSGTVGLIVFKIAKSGHKTGFSEKEINDDKTWRLLYSVDTGKNTMAVTCSAIPTDGEGHNFSDSTVFVKK